MIARISGRLEQVSGGTVLIDAGSGVWYEVLVPACDLDRHSRRVGQEVVLHTIHYLEGDPTRGNLTPRLAGFLAEADRQFFRLLTTVKGIGIRKALRAIARPVGDIAASIQAKDAKMLATLPEIGKRLAEQVIAELHGKVDDFASQATAAATAEMPAAATEAISVLVQLGERRPDAVALVERVLAVAPDLASPEEIIQSVYRLKAGGAV